MLQDQTLKSIEQHVSAIALCLQSGLPGPALILTYVGIDAFGALGRPVGHERNVRNDFVAWADRYMVRPKQLSVTALELYGARCGLLHTLGAESTLSVAGKVRPIHYSWGNANVDVANAILNEVRKLRPDLDAITVKIEDIAAAFVDGLASFGQDVDAMPELRDEVTKRSQKMFGQFSKYPGA